MTYRLDANLLPWLTPGSKDARMAVHQTAVLRAYVPLYGSSNRRPHPPCSHSQLESPPTRLIASSSRSRPTSTGSSISRSCQRVSPPSSGYGSWMGSESHGTSSDRLTYPASPTDSLSVASERHSSPAPAQRTTPSTHVHQPARMGSETRRPSETVKEKRSAEDGRSAVIDRFHSTGYVSRPQSASSHVRLERRHRSQMLRPASASPSLHSSVTVTGHGYGSERPQVLLKIHHPPIPQDIEPPPLAWMNIARPAQLHHRPQSSKPQIRSQLPPKKRVSSAPPRLRSRTHQKVDDIGIPEVRESAPPPTTPTDTRSVCSEPPQEDEELDAIDTPMTTEPSFNIPTIVVDEPIIEEDISNGQDLGDEEVVLATVVPPLAEDEDKDEGYAGDTDVTDKEPEGESEEEVKTTGKRRLARASFNKKKQSLLDGKDLLDEFMRMRHKVKKSKSSDTNGGDKSMPAWMKSRLMPSKRSCRFELPVDMRLLEGMSPAEYLSNFCVVSEHRQKWFNQAFTTADRERRGHLGVKELKTALRNVHSDALSDEDLQLVIKVTGLDGKLEVGRKLFHGIAALSERILSNKLQTTAFSQTQRDLLEEADFEALQWKLRGVNVKEELLCLFNHLTT